MGDIINAAVIGPIDGKYVLVAREVASGFIIGKVGGTKEKIWNVLITVLKRVINLLRLRDQSIAQLRRDNEFKTNAIEDSCNIYGISIERTAPNCSYQNDAAESTIGYSKKKMRVMHIDSGITKKREYSFKHTIFLSNHLVKENRFESAYTLFTGNGDISVSKIISFGCQIFHYNYKRPKVIQHFNPIYFYWLQFN